MEHSREGTICSVENMIQMMEENMVTSRDENRMRKIFNNIAESRETMPFIFFQPCDVCTAPASFLPARKLNEKYANFAKENYPQLYEIIIAKGKEDAGFYNGLHR